MKTVKIIEPLNIGIEETEIPKRGKDEALLKIKYVGFCGSDVAIYKGTQPFGTYPRIPGHEFSAEIVDIDENERGFKKGMIVTVKPYFNCGKCFSCKNGKTNCCEFNQTMGVQRDGAFSEYCVVPVNKLVDGKGVSADMLALVEPFCIGHHAIKRADIKKGDRVLVFGAGPIGTFAAMSAKQFGATVLMTDLLEKRLELAKELGVDYVVTSDKLDEKLKELSWEKEIDVCVEAAGIAPTFLNCIKYVGFGGKIVLIGNGKTEVTFNHSVLLQKEVTVFGSRNSIWEFEEAIDMIVEGKLDLQKIVTHVLPFDDAKKAFDILANNDGSASKVLLKL